MRFTCGRARLVVALATLGLLAPATAHALQVTTVLPEAPPPPAPPLPPPPPAPVAPTYEQIVLADGPAGYWRFGEKTGRTLIDASPGDNDGTYVGRSVRGALGAIVGDPNTAVSFNSVRAGARIPDDKTLDVGDSFTAEYWIKRSSSKKSIQLMNKGRNGLQIVVLSKGSGRRVLLRKASVQDIARSRTGVGGGKYSHIVATKNGSKSAKIYINGVNVTDRGGRRKLKIQNTRSPLYLGPGNGTLTRFDDFALYDRALTAAEVLEHYRAGRRVMPS